METEVVTEQPPVQSDKTALAVRTSIEQVQGAISEFDKIAAGLAELEKAHPSNLACDCKTVNGMREAVAGRAAWRDPRIATEKARKAGKAPVLALGKDMDARAAYITEQLLIGESNYDDQIKAEEARREAERLARAAAEVKRVTTIQGLIEVFSQHAADAAFAQSANEIGELLAACEAVDVAEATFAEFTAQALAKKESAVATIRLALTRRVEQDAEAARMTAERAELERMRAEQVERERVERERVKAEQAAERERLVAERRAVEAREAAARADQERIDREATALRVRLDAEAAAERRRAEQASAAERAEADRIAREAREAEDRRAAAARAERQRIADEEATGRAAEIAAKEAADEALRQAAPTLLLQLKVLRAYVAFDRKGKLTRDQFDLMLATADLVIATATVPDGTPIAECDVPD